MSSQTTRRPGRVAFVGAGPGSPDLLTVRAVERIRSADVVVHDSLVPIRLIDAINPAADRLRVDREQEPSSSPGAATGRLLARLALEGRRVVRLKGGDPTVFARLVEELEPLRRAGVAVELVPGVTAALAAAAAAGVPLTSRDASSSVTLVTGREADGKADGIDFGPLASLPGTLAIYMGVDEVARWSRDLLEAGMPAATPVTVVSRCSWPDERIGRSTLAGCARDFERAGWRAPAIAMIGVEAPAAAGPLAGRLVLVTRPEGQAAEFVAAIRDAGGECLHVPLVDILDPPEWGPVDDAIRRAHTYDWLVFASRNGVRAFVRRLAALRLDGRALGTARLAAIGPATGGELEAAGFRCDSVADDHRSEGLSEALRDRCVRGRYLLVRADRGRDLLRRDLEARGHHVDEVVAYVSRPIDALPPGTMALLDESPVDWITLTSPSIAETAVRLFGERMRSWRTATISGVTSEVLLRHGLRPTVEAAAATVDAVVDAIVAHEPPAGLHPSPESAHPAKLSP